jgi:DNA polymerase III subunit epsilon
MTNIALRPGAVAFKALIDESREQSIRWAQQMLAMPPQQWLILDTETTGLDERAEIIQIGVTDGAGNALMDNLLCAPSGSIPPGATAVHHITNDMVKDAPPFLDRYKELVSLAAGKVVVIYNKAYDLRMIDQSIARFSSYPLLVPRRWDCAMLAYSKYVGEWNDYRGDFKWQKLQGGDHSALGDCRATLEVIKKMAGG